MRTRISAAAATVAALCAIASPAVSAASATTSGVHPRYVVLTGDTHYVVFAEAGSSRTLDPYNLGNKVQLYALGRTGRPIDLGAIGPQPRVLSLSQSNLVLVNPYLHHHRIRWWNLATGRNGAIATNENVVGATPDGWLTEDGGFPDGTHVVARRESGRGLVDYGTPLTPGVDYAVTVGPNGFVAYADNSLNDNGEVTYTPWSPPVRHRTLIAPGAKNIRCDSVSASYAGCVLGSGIGRFVALVALRDGTRAQGGNRCADQVTVWGAELAWNVATARHSCPRGHVGVMSTAATTRTSTLAFDPRAVTAAWRRLVTSSHGQRMLVTLTGVRAQPSPLRRANVS